MKLLALEFSSPLRSVAYVQAGSTAGMLKVSEVIESGPGGMKPIGMIEQVLHQAQVEREQIQCIAVGLGPGSYTGIRAALALAQGWQLAREIKLLGLSSADTLAAQAQSDGLRGRVTVVIDAQRKEFYLGTYELADDDWRALEPLRLATMAEVQNAQAGGSVLVGPEITKWFGQGRVIVPRAAMLGRLALGRTDFVPGEKLEPIYLRPVQFVKAPPPRIVPL